MTLAESIFQKVQHLPKALQEQVLYYIDHLKPEDSSQSISKKFKHSGLEGEIPEWSQVSISSAMSGLEEDSENYKADDVKEHFNH